MGKPDELNDFRDLILNSFNKKVQEGAIQEIVDKQVDNFVKEVTTDTLRSYSDFSKAFKEKLEEELIGCLGKFSLHEYNALIIETVRKRIEANYVNTALQRFDKELDELFQVPDQPLTLSHVIDELKKCYEEDARDDGVERVTLHIEESKYSSRPEGDRTYFIYFDPIEDLESHGCRYRLFVSEGKVCSASVKREHFSISRTHPKKTYESVAKRAFLEGNRVSDFEKLLFHMLVNECEITVDQGAVNTYYEHDDY